MALVKCESCEHNYSDKAKKCPFCGNKPGSKDKIKPRKTDLSKKPNKVTQIKKSTQTNQSKIIPPILLAVTIFIGVLVFFISQYGNKANRFYKYINKGDYTSAQEYIDSKLSDDDGTKSKITNKMLQRIRDCEEKYNKEEKNREEALEELDNLSKISLVQTEAAEAKGRVEELGRSRDDYAAGLEREAANDYIGAMEKYNLVIERDSNYQTAREKYEVCFQNFKTETLQKAEGLRLEKTFDEAISILEACQAARGDEEVGQALSAILQEKQDYDNQIAEQARIEADQEAERQRAEREARGNHLRSLIKVSRVSCDEPNSEGGVDLYINFKNMSDKKIQSITFRVVPVNDAGEVLTCKNSNKSTFGAFLKGPFRKGDGLLDQNRYWPNAWYNKSITGVKLIGVDIEYNKGVKEIVSENEVEFIFK